MAKIRGALRRPMRIKQPDKHRPKHKNNNNLDQNVLGDDDINIIRQPTIKPNRPYMGIKQFRQNNSKAQKEQFLLNVQRQEIEDKLREERLQNKQPEDDPWSSATVHQQQQNNNKQSKANDMYKPAYLKEKKLSVNAQSAYSYNPDRKLLSQAQTIAASEYITTKINEIQKKIDDFYYGPKKAKFHSFSKQNSDQQAVDLQMEAYKDEISKLLSMQEQLENQADKSISEVTLDSFKKRKIQLEQSISTLQENVAQVKKELQQIKEKFEEELAQSDLKPHEKDDKRIEFEASVVQNIVAFIEQNESMVSYLRQQLLHFKDDQLDVTYALPLESETGSMRKIVNQESLGEHVVQMENLGIIPQLAIKGTYVNVNYDLTPGLRQRKVRKHDSKEQYKQVKFHRIAGTKTRSFQRSPGVMANVFEKIDAISDSEDK